jgi:hypothetical protein
MIAKSRLFCYNTDLYGGVDLPALTEGAGGEMDLQKD